MTTNRFIKFAVYILALTMTVTLPSCGNDDEPQDANQILKPISENILGKWKQTKCYSLQDNGKWMEEIDEAGTEEIMTFNADGKTNISYTAADGMTTLHVAEWRADEADNTLWLGPHGYSILSLGKESFIWSLGKAIDSSTGELIDGKWKWEMTRIDSSELNLAEKLVGKWVFSKTYQKIEGKWEEISFGLPDEGYYDFKEDGSSIVYSRLGSDVITSEMNWSVDCKTGKLQWYKGETKGNPVIISISGDQLSVEYNNNFDQGSGEIVTARFKDILIRED